MPTALNVAEYFLIAPMPNTEISNLKLQKLCAYAQAISLAYDGVALFDEDMEAWEHGPVIPSVYDHYKSYGAAHILPRLSLENALKPFSQEQKHILQATLTTYNRFTEWALRDQSHWDFPGEWGSSQIIDKDEIKKAFQDNPLVKRMRTNQKELYEYVLKI